MQTITFRIFRTVFWLALALYLGGLVALGAIAAPKIFSTLQSTHDAVTPPAGTAAPTTGSAALWNDPRQIGGEVFGNILAAFSKLEISCMAAMLLAIVGESLLFRGVLLRKRCHLARIALVIVVAGLLAYDTTVLWPDIIAQRTAWRESTDPSAKSTAKTRFDALHKTSESLAHTKVYILLALLLVTALTGTAIPSLPQDKAKTT